MNKMSILPKSLLLLSLLVCLETVYSTSVVFESEEPETDEVLGYIGAANGFTCGYFERRVGGGGGGPRELVLNCKKTVTIQPKKKGKKPKTETKTYKCVYRGNPHSCKWYNKKGNQPKFYALMAKFLESNKTSACTYSYVIIHSKCPNVRFNKVGVEELPRERITMREIDIDEY